MACFYSADALATLREGRGDVQRKFRELQERYIARSYKSDRAREYANHGFCRRLDELARAVDSFSTCFHPKAMIFPKEITSSQRRCLPVTGKRSNGSASQPIPWTD
jgi:hypothetical protein